MPADFYSVLGVPRNATTEQIKERFLQLTREKHPDRFPGAEKQKAEELVSQPVQN
jgi:curved DNA-binding protein CbpA